MAAGPAGNLLLEAGVVFAVLAISGSIASRLGQSVIPAYILFGILIGPFAPEIAGQSLTLIETREFIDLLAELGIVFLLFFIGLEFSFDRLLQAGSKLGIAGGVDFVVNFGIGVLAGFALGFSPLETFFLAGIVYASSSAIITKTLVDLGWIADPESETILGVLVFEDIVLAVYLAILTALAFGDGGLAEIGASLARSGAFLVVLVALAARGQPLIERLLDVQSSELFLLRIVGAIVFVGGLALAFGVSEAVAAFFIGAAFGTTSHAHRIERIISSERDIYAAVFFFSIGLSTNPRLLVTVAVPVLVLVVVTTASKLFSGYVSGQRYNLGPRRSVRVSLAMIARGEFSLVVAAIAATAGGSLVLSETIPAIGVGYVLVMSILGTMAMRYSKTVERWLGVAV
ncbi:cation:proton antiporter [Haladaptatus sp. DJG-WS-42]|uniref:cation:proton antiporter n=1 Tax=Haladaptatus sp. DJG-WS-42 TaxID=3120516 RepID=UPI0030CF3F81